MKELQGTEKQIIWAEQIRTKMVTDLETVTSKFENNEKLNSSKGSKTVIVRLNELKVVLENKTSSHFWIKVKNKNLLVADDITELTGNEEVEMVCLTDNEDAMLAKMFKYIEKISL